LVLALMRLMRVDAGFQVTNSSSIYAGFFLCSIAFSCDLDFPKCLGCVGEETCICVKGGFVGCKPHVGGNPEDKILCILLKTDCNIVSPTTCCKGVTQCFCIDCRLAFPCDSEVPCICTLLPFCVIGAYWQAKFSCMGKVAELKPTS